MSNMTVEVGGVEIHCNVTGEFEKAGRHYPGATPEVEILNEDDIPEGYDEEDVLDTVLERLKCGAREGAGRTPWWAR